jgi:hypothetical protein
MQRHVPASWEVLALVSWRRRSRLHGRQELPGTSGHTVVVGTTGVSTADLAHACGCLARVSQPRKGTLGTIAIATLRKVPPCKEAHEVQVQNQSPIPRPRTLPKSGFRAQKSKSNSEGCNLPPLSMCLPWLWMSLTSCSVALAACIPTTAISGGAQRQGIRTWHFLWNFACGASWNAVALYLPPKAELFFGLRGLGVAQPGRRVAAQGGEQGGERPRPCEFCAVTGWERASRPTRRAK